MREIEVLVKVREPKAAALKKLSRFEKDHIARISDKYYYHPRYKEMLPTKNRNALEMLRVRQKDNKSYITYKRDIFSGKRWLYSDEHETGIEDPNIIEDILKMLDFKELVVVQNDRTIYNHKEYEICLEDVKGLGLFLEIECLRPGKRGANSVRKSIFSLIASTRINVSEEVQAGKAELLYRKRHDLQ